MYGTDHIYGVDLFNEVEAPSWDPVTLAAMSSDVYKSMSDVDPQALWLQMGWMFYYDQKHWTRENVEALADRRTGREDAAARKVWMSLTDSVYVGGSFSSQTPLMCARPCLEGASGDIFCPRYISF